MTYTNPIVREERLKALHKKVALYQLVEDRERCESSLSAFFEGAWPYINSAEYQSGWAIDAMCLPYDSLVMTKEGKKSIGDIVESNWKGLVLSYDHGTGKLEWKRVIRTSKSSSKDIMVIRDESGKVLRLTVNHPLYIAGRGYVKAECAKPGEKILRLRKLRRDVFSEIQQPGPVLQSSLLRRVEKLTRDQSLSKVWRTENLGWEVLSSLLDEIKSAGRNLSLWLLRMFALSHPRSTKPDFSYLWGVLQQAVFWVGDSGIESSAIYGSGSSAVSISFFEDAAQDIKARWKCLFPLWEEKKIGRSSYRPQYQEQPSLESRVFVSQVPSALPPSRYAAEDYEIIPTIIESVEREIPIPETVYNLEVLDNHNYFADGILVHNCDHLEALAYGHIPRLLINCPPRCSKTSLVSIAFPAWVWAQIDISYLSGPQVEFLCASYGHTLALDSSNKCRRLIASPWYQERWGHRFQLRYDQNTKFHWENDKGGARIATSVGGTLLGLGGAILLADDLNNTQDVESDAERESVKNFWQEFHTTRLNDPRQSAIAAIQQRLHENDNSGLILKSVEEGIEKWVQLRIPMRYETGYSYHTVVLPQYDSEDPWDDPRSQDGELMWPERFGEEEVHKLESQLGPYLAAGRLQQRPAPKGGGILQRDWWQPWDVVEAARYGLEWKPLRRDYPTFELVIASLDTAYGEKEENDYNALTIWGLFLDLTGTRRAMLAYAWNKHLSLNGRVLEQKKGEANLNFRDRQQQAWGLVEWVADTCKRYHVQRLLIENKTRGVDVANELRRLYSRNDWGIQLVNPQKDKVARAHSVVPLFTDNSIYAPIDRQWCAEVINQCALFPKADHDDLVDSVTQALYFMRSTGLLLRAEEQEAEVNDSIRYYNQEESVRERYGV